KDIINYVKIYIIISVTIICPKHIMALLLKIQRIKIKEIYVVPPQISTNILPVGSQTGNSDPMAAAKRSTIGNASLAPACLAASTTARSSTIVIPEGTHMITFGLPAKKERFFIA